MALTFEDFVTPQTLAPLLQERRNNYLDKAVTYLRHSFAPALRLLAARQGAPILLAPFLAAEATPEWTGNYEFVEAERGSRHQHRV